MVASDRLVILNELTRCQIIELTYRELREITFDSKKTRLDIRAKPEVVQAALCLTVSVRTLNEPHWSLGM
jgi:hypothetical protein